MRRSMKLHTGWDARLLISHPGPTLLYVPYLVYPGLACGQRYHIHNTLFRAMQAMEDEAESQQVEAIPDGGAAEQNIVPDGRKMVLDWKGDPMYINPGDKLPF